MDGYMDFLATSAGGVLLDEAGLDVTGDIELRFDIAPNDWTPASLSWIMDRYLVTGDQRVWRVQLATNGTINFITGDNAGIFRTTFALQWDTSGVPADGTRKQLRITLDADNGSTQTVCTLYSRTPVEGMDLENDSGWIQENQDSLAGVQTWLANSTADVWLHSSTGAIANGFVGKFYRAVMWADLTRTSKRFDINFTNGDAIVGGDETEWNDPVRTDHWTISGGSNAVWHEDSFQAALYATGTASFGNVVNESDTTVNLHASVDDDPDSSTDSDWVNNTILV